MQLSDTHPSRHPSIPPILRPWAADLHIHTALSPCAEKGMTPLAIVAAALAKGLAMIAICDHNSAANVAAVQEAAGDELAVLAGIEVTTAEEVHVLGFFPGAWAARAVGDEVRATLPEAGEAASRFGEQVLLDATGEVRGRETRLLSAASAFGLTETVARIHRRNGLAVASHVDRPAFGVIGQLGFFPADARFDAIEVSASSRSLASDWGALGLPILRGSDSHFLGDVGTCRTILELREPTFGELALALRGLGGRRCS